MKRKIECDESTQSHLVSKMQQQSHRIMGNFISRFIHASIARGFYTWIDKMKDMNNKKRFLKSTLLYWMKNQQAKGFRRWADFSLKQQEFELATKLHNKENERRDLVHQKEQENRD